jgi:hypothetical protein
LRSPFCAWPVTLHQQLASIGHKSTHSSRLDPSFYIEMVNIITLIYKRWQRLRGVYALEEMGWTLIE